MKTMAEIREVKELEILRTGLDGFFGMLHLPGLRKCTVIASWGGGWEHVSVCPKNRTPDWNEMCRIKDMFWNEDETVVQYHPANIDYVNLATHCLHLWRPINQEIPKPPMFYV